MNPFSGQSWDTTPCGLVQAGCLQARPRLLHTPARDFRLHLARHRCERPACMSSGTVQIPISLKTKPVPPRATTALLPSSFTLLLRPAPSAWLPRDWEVSTGRVRIPAAKWHPRASPQLPASREEPSPPHGTGRVPSPQPCSQPLPAPLRPRR